MTHPWPFALPQIVKKTLVDRRVLRRVSRAESYVSQFSSVSRRQKVVPKSSDGIMDCGGAQFIVTEYAPGTMPESTPTCPGTLTETNSRVPLRNRKRRVASPMHCSGESRERT